MARKEADAAAAIAETEATVVEQRAMVERLTGCEIVEVAGRGRHHHARPHT